MQFSVSDVPLYGKLKPKPAMQVLYFSIIGLQSFSGSAALEKSMHSSRAAFSSLQTQHGYAVVNTQSHYKEEAQIGHTFGLFSVLVPGAGLTALAGEVVFAVAMLETCSYAPVNILVELTHWAGFGRHLQ